MHRRPLTPLAVLTLVATLGAAGCADDVAPAARVGDGTITRDELLADVEEWAGNDATQFSQDLPIEGTPRGFATPSVAGILGERILLEIVEQEFDERALTVGPDARAQAFSLIGIDAAQEEQLLGGFSDSFRAEYLARWDRAAALQAELGDEIQSVIAASAADVEVDPRYGTWDPASFSVLPPEGPRPAPGATAPEL